MYNVNIVAGSKYQRQIDEIYKAGAKTSILEGSNVNVIAGPAGKFYVAKESSNGLGDYTANGYPTDKVALTWEEITRLNSRAVRKTVDRLDNFDSMDVVAASLYPSLIRNHVAPETDILRISTIAKKAPVANTVAANLTTGADVISAINVARTRFANTEVSMENLVLFINPALTNLVRTVSMLNSPLQSIFADMTVVEVPGTRMFTDVTLKDGTSELGFTTGGVAINFLLIDKSAVICKYSQWTKEYNPGEYPGLDSFVLEFRNENWCSVFDNKVNGIYLHTVAGE